MTITPLPPRSNPTMDRRNPLDRRFPAMLSTEHANGTTYHYVKAGDTETLAQNAADQRMIATLHNLGRLIDRGPLLTKDELAVTMREPITDGGDVA